MPDNRALDSLDVGYDAPAAIGMPEDEIQTPCLIVDLDPFERNLAKMREHSAQLGVSLRAHGKMHKSVDVARRQIALGGASGVCCQKVSEAEAFARGGIDDLLISNQVRDPAKIDRLARLPGLGARTIVCVDDIDNVAELSEAAQRRDSRIECLVEIDCGAGRCGVTETSDVVAIARAIAAAPGLIFSGVQAYNGAAQHLRAFEERREKIDMAIEMAADAVEALSAAGLPCPIVTGAGTGSYPIEGASGVYTEIQCGSYAFMDADYGRVRDAEGDPLSARAWEHALFVLTSVMSHVKADRAICDAGLKSLAVDSGLPIVWGREDVEYKLCNDEHGVIHDPQGALRINQRLRLVPGHCDPTCNLHDWYVGVRDGRVETLWPISARGKAY